jgi:hypothetical protein
VLIAPDLLSRIAPSWEDMDTMLGWTNPLQFGLAKL